jgi:hypothetical protein
MGYIYRTNVPNTVFDVHLKDLGYAELKVLLVVIRQTYGWRDAKTNSFKRWDWISQRFFVKKTGLSQRSVSTAISKLIAKRLIVVKNTHGTILNSAQQRQHEAKLYFSCLLEPQSCEVNDRKAVKELHTTIIKHTKKYREVGSQGMKRISFKKR